MWKESGNRLDVFSTEFKKLLGIRQDPKTGRRYVAHKDAQMGVDEFSLRDLTESFLDQEFVSELRDGPLTGTKAQTMSMALNEATQARLLMEDVGGVGPSVFQDINAWNASVAGLIEVRILEEYNSPEFIADEFMRTEPTQVNGGKITGIPYPSPSGDVVDPGVEYPDVGMNEVWVFAKPNFKYGEKLGLTREAIVYNLHGDLLSKAGGLGKGLGWAKEYLCACQVLGLSNLAPLNGFPKPSLLRQTGDNFRMNVNIDAVPNPTYQTAGVTTNPNLKNAYNYINQQSQAFTDWTSIQAARNLLSAMKEPVYQLPMQGEITKIYVDYSLYDLALYILHQSQILNVTGTPAGAYGPLTQGAGSTFPPVATGINGYPAGSELNKWVPYKSAIWHQAQIDAGVSSTNVGKRWWAGDPKKAFVWRSAWDTRVDQANPTSSDLLSRDLVNLWVGRWSGQFATTEPRYMVKNTE
jgi:hypothetical protein